MEFYISIFQSYYNQNIKQKKKNREVQNKHVRHKKRRILPERGLMDILICTNNAAFILCWSENNV